MKKNEKPMKVTHGFELEFTVTATIKAPRDAYDPGVTPEGVAELERENFDIDTFADSITGIHVTARPTSWAEEDRD